MKKSFDYFKTLKEMSDCVHKFWCAVMSGDDSKQFSVSFYGKRYELSEKLFNDFVAPVERNDIYNLSHCLYMQICELTAVEAMSGSSPHCFNKFKDDFSDLLMLQSSVLMDLSKKSDYPLLIKTTRDGQLQANTVRRSFNKEASGILRGGSQTLYNYVVVSRCICFCQLINDLFCQCERVIINNI